MTTTRSPISFIATAQPDLALAFYGETLRLTLTDHSPYALVFADKDHTLRVQIVAELTPAPFTVHGWQVVDIEHEIAALTANGVRFETFEQMQQTPSGVWETPNGDKIAWFKDPCGNVLSLTEYA